jgi:hypothetical protein
MSMVPVKYWQGGKPWGTEQIFTGVSMGGSGCVISSAAIVLSMLLGKVITPMDVLTMCRKTPGSLVNSRGKSPGSLMVWPVVCKAFGVLCDESVAGVPGLKGIHDFGKLKVDDNADLAGTLAEAMTHGLAAVRVDIDGDGKGDHTIACVGRDGDGFLCSDPALGKTITLDANLEKPDVFWGPKQKLYRAVAVRAVYLTK